MSRLLGHRPSPALVVAVLALFIAMAGTGYAAIKLPANSVATAQLRDDASPGRNWPTTASARPSSRTTAPRATGFSGSPRTARQGRSARTPWSHRLGGPEGGRWRGRRAHAVRRRRHGDPSRDDDPRHVRPDDPGGLHPKRHRRERRAADQPVRDRRAAGQLQLDSGIDPTTVGLAQTANVQTALTANTDNDLGGPGPGGGTGYSRVHARGIMVGAARTFTLTSSNSSTPTPGAAPSAAPPCPPRNRSAGPNGSLSVCG